MTKTIKFGEIEEHIDEIESKYRQFNNFDTHDHTPYDHNFYRMFDLKTNKLITNKDSSHSRIELELSRLAQNTPDWAFVRSYKDRPDLIRAALVGPPNTPYHNCLFFFDIELSRNYPSKPPRVHYRSLGLELNPNLRPDGRVNLPALSEPKLSCLVSSNEMWDPDESNLLRVFVAIRDSLSTTRGRNNINRRVFALACEKMIKTLREPPSDFREFVQGHFRKYAHSVLMRFREGRFRDNAVMVDLFVKMFKVFEGNGAYCKHHICVLRSKDKRVVGIDYEAKIRELEGKEIDDTTAIISKQDRYQDQGIFDRIWSWI